jgi:hypothetical protein
LQNDAPIISRLRRAVRHWRLLREIFPLPQAMCLLYHELARKASLLLGKICFKAPQSGAVSRAETKSGNALCRRGIFWEPTAFF